MSFSNADPDNIPNINDRETIGRVLQSTLVELLDLALAGKQMHWNVIGENFLEAHRLIDEHIAYWYESADTVAERAVQLGYSVDGQAAAIARQGNNLTVGPIKDEDLIEEVVKRLHDLSARLRARITQLSALDLISQNVLIGITEEIEKELWFWRVQLQDPEVTGENETGENETDKSTETKPPAAGRSDQEAPPAAEKDASSAATALQRPWRGGSRLSPPG